MSGYIKDACHFPKKSQGAFYTKLYVETMSIKLDIVTTKYELSNRR